MPAHDSESLLGDAQRWFAAQWEVSGSISEANFVEAADLWKRNRRSRPVAGKRNEIERGGLLAYPRESLEGRGIVIATTSTDMSDKAARALAKIRKFDPSKDGYEGWTKMPLNTTLLAFNVERQKKGKDVLIEFDGFWETPIDKRDYKVNTTDGLTIVRRPGPERTVPIADNERMFWERDIRVLCQLFRNKPELLPPKHTWDDWSLLIEDAWTILNDSVQAPPAFPSRSKDQRSGKATTHGEDSPLDTVSDAALRAAIRKAAKSGTTFQTTEVIRELIGVYLRDQNTRGNASANVRFARRMSKDRKKLGIRLVRRDESVKDDSGGTSMTSRWAVTD